MIQTKSNTGNPAAADQGEISTHRNRARDWAAWQDKKDPALWSGAVLKEN